jgi:uracil-DNA glycosylase
VFVGEAPGAEEDRVGIPFVGRSGRILDAAIATLGLTSDGFGVMNVLKCRPPDNRFDRGAAAACRPHFERQLTLLAPRALVSLGASALRALDPGAPPMMQAAGRPRTTPFGPLFPLVHPAASLRSGAMRLRWSADLGRLAEWVAATGL